MSDDELDSHQYCDLAAGWRHALRSEWPFIIIIIIIITAISHLENAVNDGK